MKTSGSLPPAEGSLLGKCLLEEGIVKLTQSCTNTHPHTLPMIPYWGNSDRGSPTCHCGSNYPAGSLHGPSPAGLHITNHITEHTHTECAHCTPHILYIFTHTQTHTHAWLCFSSTIHSPQANGSNESQWCVGADILLKPGETHIIIMWMWVLTQAWTHTSSVLNKCSITDETARKSANTHTIKPKLINKYAKAIIRQSLEM